MNSAETQESFRRRVVVPLEREHKVIWYRFDQALPEVSPANPSASTLPPPDQLPSSQRIVTAPQARPGKQFIWVPAPKIQIQQDLKTPNLVALQMPSLPPPPERAKPKDFRAPEAKKPARQTPSLPAPPTVAGAGNSQGKQLLPEAIAGMRVTGPPAKAFVAPMERPGGPGPVASLPSPPAVAVASEGGSGSVSAVIIGMKPVDSGQIALPEGSRQARIAAGPEKAGSGEGGLGESGASPIVVPDVSIRGRPAEAPTASRLPPGGFPPGASPTLTRTPAPRLPFQFTPSVSVPQWPNARTLPRAIETKFQGRVAYATVMPAATGDWVLWFGEREPTQPGTRLLMRPPTPLRTVDLPALPAENSHKDGKMQVAGVIQKDGRLSSLVAVGGSSELQGFLQALHEWEFTPAMRNGTPVEVEVILEIPVVYNRPSIAAQ